MAKQRASLCSFCNLKLSSALKAEKAFHCFREMLKGWVFGRALLLEERKFPTREFVAQRSPTTGSVNRAFNWTLQPPLFWTASVETTLLSVFAKFRYGKRASYDNNWVIRTRSSNWFTLQVSKVSNFGQIDFVRQTTKTRGSLFLSPECSISSSSICERWASSIELLSWRFWVGGSRLEVLS